MNGIFIFERPMPRPTMTEIFRTLDRSVAKVSVMVADAAWEAAGSPEGERSAYVEDAAYVVHKPGGCPARCPTEKAHDAATVGRVRQLSLVFAERNFHDWLEMNAERTRQRRAAMASPDGHDLCHCTPGYECIAPDASHRDGCPIVEAAEARRKEYAASVKAFFCKLRDMGQQELARHATKEGNQ